MDLTFLTLIFPALAALVGFPALLAWLINVGKYFGIVPDSAAPKVLNVSNLLVLVGVGSLVATGKHPLLAIIGA